MKTMTKREAIHKSAELWAAAAEAPVYILERGEPRFRVEAIKEYDPLAEYERRGLLTRADPNPPPFGPPKGPRYTSDEGTALLEWSRGERWFVT